MGAYGNAIVHSRPLAAGQEATTSGIKFTWMICTVVPAVASRLPNQTVSSCGMATCLPVTWNIPLQPSTDETGNGEVMVESPTS